MAGEITLVADRLKLCNADISGLTSFKEPPPFVEVDYPPFSVVIPPEFTEDVHTNMVFQTYIFRLEYYIRPYGERSLTTAQETSQGVADMYTYHELIKDYYNTHRRLATNTLANLEIVMRDIVMQGSPQFPMPAHDGNPYFGLSYNITVQVVLKS